MASEPVAGEITVVGSTPTSVTVLVTQTAGAPTTLLLGQSCRAGDHVFRYSEQSVTSGQQVTISAEHKLKGQTVVADVCGISLSERLGGKSYRSLDWFVHEF